MKKTFRIAGLDCATCAAELEAQLLKLEGVRVAHIIYVQG